MSKIEIDPELVDDKDDDEQPELVEVELPSYDPSQFELDEDFEVTEDDGDE